MNMKCSYGFMMMLSLFINMSDVVVIIVLYGYDLIYFQGITGGGVL